MTLRGMDAALFTGMVLTLSGCAAASKVADQDTMSGCAPDRVSAFSRGSAVNRAERAAGARLKGIQQAAHSSSETESEVPGDGAPAPADSLPLPPLPPLAVEGQLTLDEVLDSVRVTYPLLRSAYLARQVTAGEQVSAWGAFDTKLKGSALNQPLGDYENYRFSTGVEQPTFWGGNVFAEYRLGRGEFEPWYLERETDQGGEFSAGVLVPFAQNRGIDPRRAELWRSTSARAGAEFDIQSDQIAYFQAAALAYWDWVAAGEIERISEALLKLARDRVAFLEGQIEAERIAPIALVDNERLIVSREAKLTEARQKLLTSAIKLSLFLRNPAGEPLLPPEEWLPDVLPVPGAFNPAQIEADILTALANRPEPRQLAVQRQQLEIELSLARNQTEPTIDGIVKASQDVGQDASTKSKGSIFEASNKDELILEAGLLGEVPLQRRKARGKILALEAKLAQNAARLEFTENKIVADVQSVGAALTAAVAQYEQATRAVALNLQVEEAERVRLQEQRSDLLIVNLREQATADARLAQVAAWWNYFQAQASRRAALGIDAAPDLNQP